MLGCSGSGKSTLARRLQEKTGLPLVHLDNVFWQPDRTHIPREEFDRQLDELVRQERWILDGDYSRTYEVRIRACDTILFLDFDEDLCLQSIAARIGQTRPDLPWTEQALDPDLVEYVKRYRLDARPALLALLARYPEKQLRIFKTRAEADAWLEAL